jgi:hypothetical protein
VAKTTLKIAFHADKGLELSQQFDSGDAARIVFETDIAVAESKVTYEEAQQDLVDDIMLPALQSGQSPSDEKTAELLSGVLWLACRAAAPVGQLAVMTALVHGGTLEVDVSITPGMPPLFWLTLPHWSGIINGSSEAHDFRDKRGEQLKRGTH